MYLNGKRCYLSGPIQFGNPVNWRDHVKAKLESYGIYVFDPFSDEKQQRSWEISKAQNEHDYGKIREIAKQFVRKDLSAVDRSDFIIANVEYMVPTYGTTHEIINSNNAKKPTMIVCEEGKNNIPFWFWGFIDHNHLFGSWKELFNYLDEVNDGKHKNNDRWAYVYGLI